jgi:hypothetical protein
MSHRNGLGLVARGLIPAVHSLIQRMPDFFML